MIVALLSAFCFSIFTRHLWKRRAAKSNFPGPPTDPFIGHLRIFPYLFPWVRLTEWAKQYGHIIQLFAPGKTILVLSEAEDAHYLLDKKGSNYSDRPSSILHGKLGGLEDFLALIPYGDDFRAHRRLITQYFNSRQHVNLLPLIADQVKILLENLRDEPERFEDHLDRASAGSIVKSTYGHDIQSNNDEYIKLAAKGISTNAALGTIGLNPIDMIPFLRLVPSWLPGASLLRRAEEAKGLLDRVVEEPYKWVKERKPEDIQPCFFDGLLNANQGGERDIDQHQEYIYKKAAAQIYVAGVETSAVTILTFVYMMMTHPETMRTAQKELDEVLGDVLPSLGDRPNLPYVECILKETLRINPSSPLGFAHVAQRDDIYKGKHIPAGTIVLANIWAMMRDERRFADPESFNPDRFLDKVTSEEDSHIHPLNTFKPDDPASLVFGFGRRICPGRFFADASAWLTMASILSVFDILPPINPITGNEYMPKFELIGGVTAKPKSFHARFVPRNGKLVVLT